MSTPAADQLSSSPPARCILLRALVITSALAAIYIAILCPKIAAGTLWHHDELLTGNRTREMLVRHDLWTVTLNYQPDFKKPPLQYWFAAGLMQFTRNREFAVRFPSLLYAGLCLPATALLAWACRRGAELSVFSVVLPAAAVALFGYFINVSRVGLLDTGTAFYLTLALAGCQFVRIDPRWWWAVAAVSIMGAWQKAPYPLAACGVLMGLRIFCDRPAPNLRSRYVWTALAVSIIGAFAWFGIQWLRHGNALLADAGEEQASTLLRAHDATDAGFRPYLYLWWLMQDWALFGVLAPLAVMLTLLFPGRDIASSGRYELAAVCAAFGLALACTPYRAERYLIALIPLLAVVTAAWAEVTLARLSVGPRWAKWILAAGLATAVPVAAFHYTKPARGGPDTLLATVQDFRRELGPGVEAIIDREPDPDFNSADFISFYAKLRRPVQLLKSAQIAKLLVPDPTGGNLKTLIGITRPGLMRVMLQLNPRLQIISHHDGWYLWRLPAQGEVPTS